MKRLLLVLLTLAPLLLANGGVPHKGPASGSAIAVEASTAADLANCFADHLPTALAEGFGISCKLLGPGPWLTTTGISIEIPATGGVGGSFHLDLNGQTIIGSGSTHDLDVLRLDMSASDANHSLFIENGEIRYIGSGFNVMLLRLAPGPVSSHTNAYISNLQINRHPDAPNAIGIACCVRSDADNSGLRVLASNFWFVGGGGGDIFTAAVTQLNGALTSNATTITVDSTATMPSVGEACIDLAGTPECVYYTGKTATTLTGVVRGVDGTTAAAHSDNDQVDIYGGSNVLQMHSSGGIHLASGRISSDGEQHHNHQRCIKVSNVSGNATIDGTVFVSSCNGFDFGTANVKLNITATRVGQSDFNGDGNQVPADNIVDVGAGASGGTAEFTLTYDWISSPTAIGNSPNLIGLHEGTSLAALVSVEDDDSSEVCPPWITTGSVINANQTTGVSPTQIDLTTRIGKPKQAGGCVPSTTAGVGGILSTAAATFLNLPAAANIGTILRYRNVADGDYQGGPDQTDNAYVVRRISYDHGTVFSALGSCGASNRGTTRWISDGNAAGAECDAGGGTARELCICAVSGWVAAP